MSAGSLDVSNMKATSNTVTLTVQEPGLAYDIQFSPDSVVWTTIAPNRSGHIWSGPRSANPQGFFRAILHEKGAR
jgi:hypothetical protein